MVLKTVGQIIYQIILNISYFSMVTKNVFRRLNILVNQV